MSVLQLQSSSEKELKNVPHYFPQAKYLTKKTAAGSIEAIKNLDDCLIQLAVSSGPRSVCPPTIEPKSPLSAHPVNIPHNLEC